MAGWIKVHRQIFNNEGLWSNQQLIRVYLYLVFNAKIEPEVIYYMGQSIELKNNELITGRKIISDKTGVPESSVEKILSVLQKCRIIGQKKNRRFRLISILYDDFGTQKGRKYDANVTDVEHIIKKENNTNKKNVVDDTANVPRKYYYDLFNRLDKEQVTIELVMKNYFIDKHQYKYLLQQFFRSQEMVGKQWPSYTECRKHFRNWLSKQGDSVRAPIPEPVVDKTDIDDFYNSRMGPADRNPYK